MHKGVLTLLGPDGMGLNMMMSMVKLLLRYSQYHIYKTHSRYALAANHPRLISKKCHTIDNPRASCNHSSSAIKYCRFCMVDSLWR